MLKKRISSLLFTLGAIPLLYGLFSALFQGSFEGAFIICHIAVGVLLLILALVFRDTDTSKAELNFTRFGSFIDIAAVTALVVAINWYANRHEYRYDTTEQGMHSLTNETLSVLENLKYPVNVVVVASAAERNEREAAEELLRLYRYHNPKQFSYEILDPRKNPSRIEKEVGFKNGDRVVVQYLRDDATVSAHLTGFNEELITNSLVKLSRTETLTLYYVVGHDEPRLDDTEALGVAQLYELLKAQGFKVEPLVIGENSRIPTDARGVILNAPKKPLTDVEKESLRNYVKDGGGVMMMADPDSSSDIREFAAEFGIDVGQNVVIDPEKGLKGSAGHGAEIVIRSYALHEITKNFSVGDLSVFFIASTVSVAKNAFDKAAQYTELLIDTSESAWAETDLEKLFSDNPRAARNEAEDLLPPLSMAVAYSKKIADDKEARLLVFGDSHWLRNANFNIYANSKLFLSSAEWIAKDTSSIIIPEPHMRKAKQLISSEEFDRMRSLTLILPELLLILGFFVYWRRKGR